MTNEERRSGPVLEARGVSKRYGPVRALEDVTLSFAAGEIHAVLGENGAGKSTLMGMLAGFVLPDSGEVLLDGQVLPKGRPHEFRRLGIEMVHQHFALVPAFTVRENLALSFMSGLSRPLNLDTLAERALAIAEELGWSLDPKAVVASLPVGIQQRIEIVKALAGDEGGLKGRVLILDEPTAVLSSAEVEELFRVLRRLREEGRSVILIAHKLSEVLAVADRVSVLRNGRFVASAPRDEVDAETLAAWMVGEMPQSTRQDRTTSTKAGLELRDVRVQGDRGEAAVQGATFSVARGEIFGLGGVDGNGQVELAEAIAGIREYAGAIQWQGAELSSAGATVGYVPQNRQIDGLALPLSIEENLLVHGYDSRELTLGPFLRLSKARARAQDLVQRYGIRIGKLSDPVSSLSGGNQQKVVVSRCLAECPSLLVVVNPTRGLDFASTRYVHECLLRARDEGCAVVLFTTDLDELMELSDCYAFMSRGRLVEAEGAAAYVGGAAE